MIYRFSSAGSRPRRNRLSLSLLAACGAAALAASASPAQNQPDAEAAEVPAAAEAADARRAREAQEAPAAREEAALMSSTLPAPAPAVRCVAPPPDMDAWYPLDGNGVDLILAKNAAPAGVLFVPAVVLRGARLLTPASFLTVPNGPVLNQGLGDFSIDLWLYVPPQWHAFPLSVRTVIDKRTSTGGTRGYSMFYYNRRLGFQLADGAHSNFLSVGQLAPGWNHVAVSVDRDNPQGIVFYRNGAPIGTANPTGRQGNLDNSSPTLFGRNVFGHGAPSTGAVLDEIEFFDRVLRPVEVRSIAAAGRAGKCKP
jgi:hypothetical protein